MARELSDKKLVILARLNHSSQNILVTVAIHYLSTFNINQNTKVQIASRLSKG
jgi:hypothetical protein